MQVNNDELIKFHSIFVNLLKGNGSSQKEIPSKETESSNEKTLDYEVITGDEILNMDGESIPTLVDPLFPRQGLVGFAGSSDTGKSSFLKQFATAVARGESEFLGFPLNVRHRSVIYVSTEDDVHAVKTVLKKQKKKGSRSSTLKGLRFLFNSEEIFKQVEQELKKQPADVVIIDAISDILQGDFNQSNVVRPFLERFSNLSKEHECLFIFLHHTSKRSEGRVPKKGNLLGSQGFEAKCRMVSILVRDPVEDQLRHLCLVKGNYLGDEYKSQSYVLKFTNQLTFENTGERVMLDELEQTENQSKKRKETEELKARAVELQKLGKTLEEIGKEVGRDKSTISRWLVDIKPEDKKISTEDSPNQELLAKLEAFISEKKYHSSMEALRKTYHESATDKQGSIRGQFKKYLKQREPISHELFAKLLGETVQRNNNLTTKSN